MSLEVSDKEQKIYLAKLLESKGKALDNGSLAFSKNLVFDN